jgi:transcriptional regulator GlxA family with amidase domain
MPENDMKMSESDITPARTVGYLLVPGFALMSYAAALEPLRAANTLSGRILYRWVHLTAKGCSARSSAGVGIAADRGLDAAGLDAVIICAGGNPAQWADRATLRWLRSLARRRVAVAGVSGGAWLMAAAGLLNGRRCTIHWEHADSFAESFPDLDLRRTLFEIDGLRLTSAGGIAALDMMTALIARDHGEALARRVADWFVQAHLRRSGERQRMDLSERTGIRCAPVLAAMAAMESNLEEPLPAAALAREAGVGNRQVQRLFRAQLGCTAGDHYRAVRLDRASLLLRDTRMALPEVAAATGFASLSHFSRLFAARFGLPPSRFRRSQAAGGTGPLGTKDAGSA